MASAVAPTPAGLAALSGPADLPRSAALSGPADLPSFLLGDWSLRRVINDGEGTFDGVARFTADGAGGVLWHETGRLALGDYAGEAHRTLSIAPDLEAGSGWQVRFDDGRPFHALDLRCGRCRVEHRCGRDVYRGVYAAEPDRLTVRWRVTGPGRADTIASAYRRTSHRPPGR